MIKLLTTALFLFCLQFGFALNAQTQVTKETDIQKYPAVTKAVLPNGMRILVMENKTAPIVSFYTYFGTGNVDNEMGKTGLAHLLEHMAFKGSETVGTNNYRKEKVILDKMDAVAEQINFERDKGSSSDPAVLRKLKEQLTALEVEAAQYTVENEFQQIYSGLGARGLNAYTSADVTAYIVSLPANQLESWFIIEADRFKNPVFRGFYKERDVVMEELRMGLNRAGTVLFYKMLASAFEAHPYRNPVIGWQSDVERLLRKDAEAFYKKHYTADNAVSVIVGDVNAGEVIKLAEKYFADIPKGKKHGDYKTHDPKRMGERRAEVLFEASPLMYIAYNKPTYHSKDDAVFQVIEGILSSGRTSKLYKSLVEDKQLAVSVDASAAYPAVRYDNLFIFYAAPRAPHTVFECEEAIYEEIEKLKTQPVKQEEIDKVARQIEVSMISSMTSNANMARTLGTNEIIMNNWRYSWDLSGAVKAVTPQDIMRVASKYFTKDNRSVIWIKQTGAAAQDGGK